MLFMSFFKYLFRKSMVLSLTFYFQKRKNNIFLFLGDNEERSMIQPHSLDDPKLKNLVEILIEWINDELAYHRIIVKQIDEDLYDGMVLHKLIGKIFFNYSKKI